MGNNINMHTFSSVALPFNSYSMYHFLSSNHLLIFFKLYILICIFYKILVHVLTVCTELTYGCWYLQHCVCEVEDQATSSIMKILPWLQREYWSHCVLPAYTCCMHNSASFLGVDHREWPKPMQNRLFCTFFLMLPDVTICN